MVSFGGTQISRVIAKTLKKIFNSCVAMLMKTTQSYDWLGYCLATSFSIKIPKHCFAGHYAGSRNHTFGLIQHQNHPWCLHFHLPRHHVHWFVILANVFLKTILRTRLLMRINSISDLLYSVMSTNAHPYSCLPSLPTYWKVQFFFFIPTSSYLTSCNTIKYTPYELLSQLNLLKTLGLRSLFRWMLR